MTTFKALIITESGEAKHQPEYPKEPTDYCCDMGDIVLTCANTFCRCEAMVKKHKSEVDRAHATAIPVKNKEYAINYIGKLLGVDNPTKPGVYPYNGEITWEWVNPCIPKRACQAEGTPCKYDCQLLYRVAILVEHKPEVKNSEKIVDRLSAERDKLLNELESLRSANKELVEWLSFILKTYRMGNKDETITKKLITKYS